MSRLRKDDPRAFLSPAKSPEEFAADVAELRRILDYDEISGVFRRREISKHAAKCLKGKVAGFVCYPQGGYRLISIQSIPFRAHVLAWIYAHGVRPRGVIDHVNGEPDDNRISNLRDVSFLINRQNQRSPRSGTTSGLQGVCWDSRRKKFRARLKVDGVVKSYGSYDTPEAAQAAYVDAKRKFHEGCTL